jgi:hypothetical protein
VAEGTRCQRCGKTGTPAWAVTHGHVRWSSFLLPWLGNFSGLLDPGRQLEGRQLWDDRGGYQARHRKTRRARG